MIEWPGLGWAKLEVLRGRVGRGVAWPGIMGVSGGLFLAWGNWGVDNRGRHYVLRAPGPAGGGEVPRCVAGE